MTALSFIVPSYEVDVVLLRDFEREKLSHDHEQHCVDCIDPDLRSMFHERVCPAIAWSGRPECPSKLTK